MTKRHVSLPASAKEGLHEFITSVDERLAGEEKTCDVVAAKSSVQHDVTPPGK